MKLSALKINATAVEEGAWVDNIPELGGIRLKVRGHGNAHYRRLQSRLIEATPRSQRQRGSVDSDVMDQITNKCLAQTVLLDWDGLLDDNDQPIPFSAEAALAYLSDPSLRPFRDGVAFAAAIVAQTEEEGAKDDAGNSPSA
ncbi:hypothetical protein [Aureimonas mangrovi]|uniref:hypothetical protein n=1 Tax=Aureimonas mangrovi TaxID=2758041 RepID=UPI00163DB8D1|nr:hypothetical protein [Aureimonas mangrovi]